MSYIGSAQRLISDLSAWFLRRRNIGGFLEACALTYDGVIERLYQGLAFTRPLDCDSSALPYLSRDRGIRIYDSEPVDSKRYRLSIWRQLRRQFGTHIGVMNNIAPFFLPYTPRIRVVHQDGNGGRATWYTREADGTISVYKAEPSNWAWDAHPEWWSRFWVIIYVDDIGLPPQPEWDEGQLWDGGSYWDGLINEAGIADLVAGIQEAQSDCVEVLWGVIFATDPASFDPTATAVVDADGWSTLPNGKWDYVIDNATGLPTRLPTATYAYDVSPNGP